ncbi:hypothetical protein MHU86_16384 [Fragilaria crotonensis]|nr:hypothetical protein MHU86_16384 [Fragilaria crotonensis]
MMAVSSESEIEMVPSGLSAVTSQHALDGKGERHVQQSGRKSLAITIVEPHPHAEAAGVTGAEEVGFTGCNSWRQLGRLCSMLGRVLKSAAKLRTHAVMRTGLLVGRIGETVVGWRTGLGIPDPGKAGDIKRSS